MGDAADDAFERADTDEWNSFRVSMKMPPLPGYDDADYSGPITQGQPFTANGEMAQYHLGQDDQDDQQDQEQDDPEPPPVTPHNIKCPKCDGPMHICTVHETGGRFMGCNKYPRCRGSRPYRSTPPTLMPTPMP